MGGVYDLLRRVLDLVFTEISPIRPLMFVSMFVIGHHWRAFAAPGWPCSAQTVSSRCSAPARDSQRSRLTVAALIVAIAWVLATDLPALDLRSHWICFTGYGILILADCGLLIALFPCMDQPATDD
jgi:hypothetical protein